MKVFFFGKLEAPENFLQYYSQICQRIKEADFELVDDFFLRKNLRKNFSLLKKGSQKTRWDWYRKCIKNIQVSDLMVAEVSLSSFTLGFLVNEALRDSTPVIALYHESMEPFFVRTIETEKLLVVEYNSNNLQVRLENALESARKLIDIRFNFFLPPQLITYLNWISSLQRISKSTYLRSLILADMEKNRAYKKLKIRR